MTRETPLADLIPLWRTLRDDGVTVLVTPALDYVGALELGTLDVRFGADEQAFNIGEGVRSLDVRRQAEEHVPHLARRVLLAPDAAVAEVGDGADTVVDRDAFAVARLIDEPPAGCRADLHVAERQLVAIEQLRHLRGGGQRLAFGAAVGDGLGAQGLDARPEFVARLAAQGLMPISF